MWTLHPDVEFTRRGRMHHILDETDTLRWSGKNLLSALEFLVDKDQDEFMIAGHDDQPGYEVLVRQD